MFVDCFNLWKEPARWVKILRLDARTPKVIKRTHEALEHEALLIQGNLSS